MIRRCRLSQIVDADVRAIPAGGPNGTDMFDVALCAAGIFARSPQRGTSRRRAEPPPHGPSHSLWHWAILQSAGTRS